MRRHYCVLREHARRLSPVALAKFLVCRSAPIFPQQALASAAAFN